MSIKSIKKTILEGIYIDDEESIKFCKKYGFRLEDLEVDIDEMMRLSYWCCSVKELAYTICGKIYEVLKKDYVDYCIDYKFVKEVKAHRIAFEYEDLMFIFDMKWIGNSLSIVSWDLVNEKDFDDEGFEDIESAIDDEEQKGVLIMSVELCKRISMNEKKNSIKVCSASSNIQPMYYVTYDYYNNKENVSFEEKLFGLFYDLFLGNICFSSINDSTENFAYAMVKVREYLKENNINGDDLYKETRKIYKNGLYEKAGLDVCSDDDEIYNKYVEWVKTQDKNYINGLEDMLFRQTTKKVYGELFEVFKKALYEKVEGVYNLKYGNFFIVKLGKYSRWGYERFSYSNFGMEGLAFSYKKGYIVQKNFVGKDLELIRV